jgi:hypothetical protein
MTHPVRFHKGLYGYVLTVPKTESGPTIYLGDKIVRPTTDFRGAPFGLSPIPQKPK